MHQYLQLVKAFRKQYALPEPQVQLSDMDIIVNQARLMEKGGRVLQGLKQADMPVILLRLVELAYCAVDALAQTGDDLMVRPVDWHHDGSVLSIMRLVSEQINQCRSGKAEDYSSVYCICAYLTNSFLNADFDKALKVFHRHLLQNYSVDSTGSITTQGLDLSDCLYE